jgi:hypothetical protein
MCAAFDSPAPAALAPRADFEAITARYFQRLGSHHAMRRIIDAKRERSRIDGFEFLRVA